MKALLKTYTRMVAFVAVGVASASLLNATPANKAALSHHFETFLAPSLNHCTTCHLPSSKTAPESLDEFPHNKFGARLRAARKEASEKENPTDIIARIRLVADEDSDGDGVSNEAELLLGKNPGDDQSVPVSADQDKVEQIRQNFAKHKASYRWQPFARLTKPAAPDIATAWARNPVDQFIAAEHQKRNLKPRPPATDRALLRRVYLDLIGLNPTRDEIAKYEADKSTLAYENLVDRLLEDPRHGERWGRHWMDIWRYSDWAGWSGGNQIRDSKPHIWRWRDWIVDSLNADKGYDQMLLEMLAADEAYPEDEKALRATGFLVRNYKMLSREQWLEDTVKHTSQAFMGVTVGCAKCHDHMYDPIAQTEYYQMRAIFEPHQVRTDKIAGELDQNKDGLVRAYDKDLEIPTYFFNRGDERYADTNRMIRPGVPALFGGKFEAQKVSLPRSSAYPDQRPFVLDDLSSVHKKRVADAEAHYAGLKAKTDANKSDLTEARLKVELAQARKDELDNQLEAERWESIGYKLSEAWTKAALGAQKAQRAITRIEAAMAHLLAEKEANLALSKWEKAKEGSDAKAVEEAGKKKEELAKKLNEAEKKLREAEQLSTSLASTDFKARAMETYPAESTGRRLAFAKWLIDPSNPLTARVAVNHIWARHFGRGLVPSTSDFGANGKPASHPQLLDWLASELIDQKWSMKKIHRLIVTSSLYRMSSTGSEAEATIDPDNIYLWRMPSRRMEAELVRDNLLHVPGQLDAKFGGPDIDHNLGLISPRRSLYLRIAAEKEVEFLKIFDGPNVTECYQRHPTVIPQQALAMVNNELTVRQARLLAGKLQESCGSDDQSFVQNAFDQILTRQPTQDELKVCLQFLRKNDAPNLTEKDADAARKRRENFVLTLFNHNDFVTIR
ncbi:MAG: DUF1553 domain-containing protein [Verrucomicrobiales bacterium]